MMTAPARFEGEKFAMAARTATSPRGKLLYAAGTIVALGIALAGCQSRSALIYAQQTHAMEIEAWCRAHLGVTPASQEGQDCLRRSWVNVPYRECFNNPCVPEVERYHHYARRGPIEK